MKRKKREKRWAEMVEMKLADGSRQRQFLITLHGDTFVNPLPSDFHLEYVPAKKRRRKIRP